MARSTTGRRAGLAHEWVALEPAGTMRRQNMLNVHITIDTEVWPRFPDWRECRLRQDIRRDFYGETPAGDFGVPFQLRTLQRHGLKATFFLESLFARAVGLEALREMVDVIRSGDQEVQLHLHTEWLAWMDSPLLSGKTGQNCRDFSEDEQARLIACGAANLRACGVTGLCAFRAGNYGANFDTLKALDRNGIRYDTSHNTCYLDAECGLRTPEPLVQPAKIGEVYEFPISYFQDAPRHFRHVQLCAVSSAEMCNALLAAWRAGWYSFVIVSHGFELLRRRKQTARPVLPDGVVVRRFERLCEFLAGNRDKFRTVTFGEIEPSAIRTIQPAAPLRSGVHRTMWRILEQAFRRVL